MEQFTTCALDKNTHQAIKSTPKKDITNKMIKISIAFEFEQIIGAQIKTDLKIKLHYKQNCELTINLFNTLLSE